MKSVTGCIISPATSQLQSEALALALASDDAALASQQAADLVAAERQGTLSLAGLFTACRNGNLRGATLALLQPGRTALIWPPRLLAEESESTAQSLFDSLSKYLSDAGVCLAQAVLAGAHGQDAQRLLAHGFFHAADLLYLTSSQEQFPVEPPRLPIRLEPYATPDERRLADLIQRTYEQTRDCPELDGVRDPADVLEGYRQTGVFSPARWAIAREREGVGEDLGCLLLADHPDQDQWELVYMGIIPEARGRGLGLVLTRHAQWLTRQAGRSRLVLAADARNEPALAVYRTAGFEVFDCRSVFLKVFGPPSVASRFS